MGCFRSLNLEGRTCEICNSQEIEEEFNFIISCNAYIEIRQVIYNCITSKIEEFIYFNDSEKNIHIVNIPIYSGYSLNIDLPIFQCQQCLVPFS